MTKLEQLLACDGLFVGAHRGFSSDYPENTMLAVQEACKLNVDLIEVDVYVSKDGVPVIAHDCKLERCSNGTGFICDYTLRELKQMDFGIHRGVAFEGLRLPTLEQFLDYMRNYPQILMDIDFKVYAGTLNTVHAAMPILKESGLLDRTVFNCVDRNIVHYLTTCYGRRVISAPHDMPNGNYCDPEKDVYFKDSWGICIPYFMLDQAHVDRYRSLGIAIICTPADTYEQVKKASSLGVTLPLCDDPREYLKVRDQKC